jgi:glycosyltransferase involved in cell wall biosynthesis
MNSKPLRVLYLNTAAKASGAEFALLRLLSGIERANVQPVVVFAEEGPAAELLRKAGIETHVLLLSKKVRDVRKDTLGVWALLNLGRIVVMIAYAWRIASFVRLHKLELIHTNTVKAHIYGMVAAKLAGVPVIWHIRDFVNESYFPRPTVKALRFLARHGPNHVLAVSRAVMAQIKPAANDQHSTVVLDGLSASELVHQGTSQGSGEWQTPVRIGIVGRLTPWKGQHVFIEAAAAILKRGYDVRFLIIGAPMFGEESYEQKLRERVDELGILSRVEFLGFRSDIPVVMRTLDILVHASISADPCPNTILEGMAEGVAVIGSNGGGVPEIIVDGETGLLHPMGDSNALAEAIEKLLRDHQLARRLGREGFLRVRREFTAERVARQVQEVYKQVARRDSQQLPTPIPRARKA